METPANLNDFLVDVIGNIEMPVNQQVSSYMAAHGSFKANQLVLVWAGSNDVLRAGALPSAAQTVQTAATTLAQLVGQIVQNGATHVIVINVPNVGLSPKGIASADGGENLARLSQTFNASLNNALQAIGLQGDVIQVDAYTWENRLAGCAAQQRSSQRRFDVDKHIRPSIPAMAEASEAASTPTLTEPRSSELNANPAMNSAIVKPIPARVLPAVKIRQGKSWGRLATRSFTARALSTTIPTGFPTTKPTKIAIARAESNLSGTNVTPAFASANSGMTAKAIHG